ncbi:MAG: penicillin-binding protein 2 [Thermodesulfobacteria bacterium]|nr:penicillin-binding protein 2 [Thermodesulfobacteriota bacterium]
MRAEYIWRKKIRWAFYLAGVIIGILWLRLFYLQIIRYSYYSKKAKERSIVTYAVPAPRGNIFTSDGVLVATNRAVFQLYIDVQAVKGKENQVLYRLSKILKEDFGELKEEYYLGKKRSFGRVLLKSNLNWDQVAKIMVRLYYLPGVRIEVEPQRYYPYGKEYFHLIGYVSRLSKEEYLRLRDKGYSVVDYIGKRGIERAFEPYLKGKDGYIEVERDAYGRLGEIVKRVKPIPGDDLIITVNHKLQTVAYELLKGKAGAIVALSPKDGAILAMVSSPSIDPEGFITGYTPKEWKRIVRSPLKPLINRAISAYPPGSTYKVITAFAGLMSGAIKGLGQIFYCKGYIVYKGRVFRCWKASGHGWVNLTKAIQESCDVYFYEVAKNLDIDYLAKISREFGLGEKALGWIEESKGLIPDRKWKKKYLHQIWFPGETLITAIGQGYLKVTPLQMARVYMAIANNGYLYKPYVVKEIIPFGGKPYKFMPILERKINIPLRYFRWIQRALVRVVRKGTGKKANIPGLLVAGKTGTAQVTSGESHAWFVSYAGKRRPEIVTAVFVEHGGHGGETAAPIAKKLYEVYFGINATEESQ